MFGRTHGSMFGRTLFKYCVRKDTFQHMTKKHFLNKLSPIKLKMVRVSPPCEKKFDLKMPPLLFQNQNNSIVFILLLYVWPRKERNKTKMHFIISFIFLKKCIAKSLMHGGSSLKLNYFLTFPACFRIPIFFSNLNSNCSYLSYLGNLQEQVKKAFCTKNCPDFSLNEQIVLVISKFFGLQSQISNSIVQ